MLHQPLGGYIFHSGAAEKCRAVHGRGLSSKGVFAKFRAANEMSANFEDSFLILNTLLIYLRAGGSQ